MTDQFTLQGPIFLPQNGKPEKAVVLLHGYGASGGNLIELAYEWQTIVPQAVFLCPNAPFRCQDNPAGYEWFAFSERLKTIPPAHPPENTLVRIRQARPPLSMFLDEVLQRYRLDDTDLAVMGFSQGAMMAMYTMSRRPTACAGVMAYSGAFIEDSEEAIQCCPDIFLAHGEMDDIVPISYFYHAKARLEELKFKVIPYIEPHIAHSISQKALRLGSEFLKNKLRQG